MGTRTHVVTQSSAAAASFFLCDNGFEAAILSHVCLKKGSHTLSGLGKPIMRAERSTLFMPEYLSLFLAGERGFASGENGNETERALRQ